MPRHLQVMGERGRYSLLLDFVSAESAPRGLFSAHGLTKGFVLKPWPGRSQVDGSAPKWDLCTPHLVLNRG